MTVDMGHWRVDKMDQWDTEPGGTEQLGTEAEGSLLHLVEGVVQYRSQLKHIVTYSHTELTSTLAPEGINVLLTLTEFFFGQNRKTNISI